MVYETMKDTTSQYVGYFRMDIKKGNTAIIYGSWNDGIDKVPDTLKKTYGIRNSECD
jgi:hypothetical protein